ncbi:sugar kinase [Glaciihabitans sp. INWT7]|uniref:PfkB family carbohydrate kinase n=1 Tax=Glaciihabitans sp. INWT7 TaxID=2596912 RepID=UPI0016284AFE|nr:PfkB family carbohydrate kinase [Glaciihabitans sp. INWT7]QNE47855.1 sugar kinase [Glaciihabitans sp. INWT7]
MTSRLVSVGNVIVDLTLRIPALPERGSDVLARDTGSTPGGAFNTLVAAVRQGLASAYGGAHGVGPHGDRVRSALSAEGIAVLLDPSPDADTGFDIALVDDDGERTFVTVFGAEARLAARELVSISLGAGDLVHVSGYGLLESTNAGVLAPWIAGIGPGHTVLFDPGPLATTVPAEALATVAGRADWLSCNLREALSLTGESDAGAAATALRESWRAVVIRLGPQGCLVVEDEARFVPGFAAEAIDTTGAGDAHTGAFLAALASGEPPPAAARRANACAAIAVTRRGPATAPTAPEVQRLLDGAD